MEIKSVFLIPSPVHCSTVVDIITDPMDGKNPWKNTFQPPTKSLDSGRNGLSYLSVSPS